MRDVGAVTLKLAKHANDLEDKKDLAVSYLKALWDEGGHHEGQDDEERPEDERGTGDDLGHQAGVLLRQQPEASVADGTAAAPAHSEVGGGGRGRNEAAAAPFLRAVRAVDGVLLQEVHVEEVEDEPEHGRAEAVAEAAHAGDHALDETLLVGVGVHGHEGADGGVRDAEIDKKNTIR